MSKKHIITVGYQDYAVDSTTAAVKAVEILSKLIPVQHVTDGPIDSWHYAPEDREHRCRDVQLKMNQNFREARKVKEPKPLALPAPKRGAILCICERSFVAPRQTCPHCGRAFTESHNRTHQDPAAGTNLRLL